MNQIKLRSLETIRPNGWQRLWRCQCTSCGCSRTARTLDAVCDQCALGCHVQRRDGRLVRRGDPRTS